MGFMQKRLHSYLTFKMVLYYVPPVLKHYVRFLLKGNKANGLDGKNLVCIQISLGNLL
jgi:hypothetical protein